LAGKRVVPVALAIGALGLIGLTQVASAIHARPKAASPIRVSLVPTYDPCTAPNRQHGPPLAFPSCNPPAATSSFLTVGTPDANGAAANSVSFIKFAALYGTPGPPDDDNNVFVTTQITDVRCKAGTSACGNANTSGGADYTGEVQVDFTIRLTDHFNAVAAGGGTDSATVIDFPSPVTLVCSNTADASIGGTCTISSTTQVLIPHPCGCEGKRSVYEFGQIRVSDGGPDGLAASQDNTVFMRQGIFIP
jgi:hypothetical protein